MKGEVPGSSLAEDTVEHERVEVDVQLQAAAEALDHGHGAGLALRDAVRPHGARVAGEQPAGIHAQHGAAQGVIPRQSVAQAIRQRQDPLAHRDLWQAAQRLDAALGGAGCHVAASDNLQPADRPFEFADITSNTYWDWIFDHAYLLVPAQKIVGDFLATFKDYAPRQKAASFALDQVLAKLQEGMASHH